METNYVIHENDDKTITIYSDKNQAFYRLNFLATIIFKNFKLSDQELIKCVENEFEIDQENISEILDFKKELAELLEQL